MQMALKISSFLISALLLQSSFAQAQYQNQDLDQDQDQDQTESRPSVPAIDPKIATMPDATCATSPNDRYEAPVRITQNSEKYGGKCLNTNQMRPPVTLSENLVNAVVTNIKYQNRYWVATIPISDAAIGSITFEVLRSSGGFFQAGHTQLWIHFNQPVILQLQTNFNQRVLIQDLSYSVEAAFPKGVGYDAITGDSPNFPLIDRLMSTWERTAEDRAYYAKYPLKLQAGEKAQLFKLLLQQAQKDSDRGFYFTLKRNCTSQLLDLVDELPRIKGRYPKFHSHFSTDPVIGPSIDAMQERGLIDAQPLACGWQDCRFSKR